MIIRFFGLMHIVLSVFLLSCSSEESKPSQSKNHGCLVLKDDLGRMINCPTNIARVMALSPSMTEYLALICPNKIVARTQNCNFPESITKHPLIQNYPELDIEGILKLNLDLIVTQKGITSELQIEQLAAFDIPVYVFANNDFEKIINTAEKVGVMTGCYQRGKFVKDSLQKEFELLQNNSDFTSEQKTVLGIVSKEPIFIYGPNTLFGKMGLRSGCEVLGVDLQGDYPQVDDEYILRVNPSMLITTKNIAWKDFFGQHEILKETDAYKNNKLYQIEGDYISRQGPRAIKGLKAFKEIVENAQ